SAKDQSDWRYVERPMSMQSAQGANAIVSVKNGFNGFPRHRTNALAVFLKIPRPRIASLPHRGSLAHMPTTAPWLDGAAHFATTRWTVVLLAGRDGPERR